MNPADAEVLRTALAAIRAATHVGDRAAATHVGDRAGDRSSDSAILVGIAGDARVALEAPARRSAMRSWWS